MATAQLSRRQLFRGDIRGERDPIRPPWAVPEVAFTVACDRCGDCLDACPDRIIRVGDGGFPFVDFGAGGCSFCAECLAACGGKALKGDPERDPPWSLEARIGGGCLAFQGVICRSCGEVCDEGAIRFRLRVGGAAEPEPIMENCTGCGRCLSVCPPRAVTVGMSSRPNAHMAR